MRRDQAAMHQLPTAKQTLSIRTSPPMQQATRPPHNYGQGSAAPRDRPRSPKTNDESHPHHCSPSPRSICAAPVRSTEHRLALASRRNRQTGSLALRRFSSSPDGAEIAAVVHILVRAFHVHPPPDAGAPCTRFLHSRSRRGAWRGRNWNRTPKYGRS
ncbi:hypothetical protein BJX66DRAFT_317650 [Aspergillus keveii]|uniref:Uncharacterized protein n=1 Tax=Aspergillus keveii TaxID=714993 RepID=A0ABR4FKT5_9EURO